MIKFLLILGCMQIVSCSDTTPFLRERGSVRFGELHKRPDSARVITFYALGDWGTGKESQHQVAAKLQQDVEKITVRSISPFALGLGDNIYEVGLPRGWQRRDAAVRFLHKTFGDVYGPVKYKDKTINFHVVPGNHDHAGNPKSHLAFGDVLHQETTAEAIYPFWKYYPIDPAKNIDTNDSTDYANLAAENIYELALPEQVDCGTQQDLAIFAIDSQVILKLYQKGQTEVVGRHWRHLESLLEASPASWKMIIGHHPIRSHGKHGGFVKGFWWIPPLTIVPLIDKIFVKPLQDIDNAHNRKFQKALAGIMQNHDVTFYLAGHDHSLQLIGIDDSHFQLLSGSAAKLSGTTHKDDTYFSHAANGFARFDVTHSEVWIEFFSIQDAKKGPGKTSLFRIRK